MTTSTVNGNLLNITIGLVATCIVVYILIVGRTLMLPIVTAIVVWYLIIRLTAAFSSIPFTDIAIPYPIAVILALIVTGVALYAFGNLIGSSINNIIREAPRYQAKLNELLLFFNKLTHSKLKFNELLKHVSLTSIFSHLTLTLTYLAGNLALITVYVLFLLFESKTFEAKLKAMCRTKTRYKTVHATLDKISRDINTYMKVKMASSLTTGISSYIVLMSFGIQYASFWAVLIFLLNFIPTIGSIVAVVLTLLAVSIQFTDLSVFILMALLLTAIQFIVGNFIEPKWMGKNLNLSPLIILIALAFWGTIWGILGMFLCVPLMTILNIILAKFDNTRGIAVFFAANPDIVQ